MKYDTPFNPSPAPPPVSGPLQSSPSAPQLESPMHETTTGQHIRVPLSVHLCIKPKARVQAFREPLSEARGVAR